MSDGKISRKEFFKQCGKGVVWTTVGGMLVRQTAAEGLAPQAATDEPPLPYRLEPVDVLKPELADARGIAVDREGRLYVAGEGGVQVFTADGKRARRIEMEGAWCAVAVDAAGAIYMAQRSRVEIRDAQGGLVAGWGKLGDAPGDFRYITGLVPAGHFVYVVDPGARCVHRFAVNGDFVDRIEGFHIPSGYMDAELDGQGRLHVTHTGCHAVECYDANGGKLASWGYFGPRRDGFCGCCNPTNLAFLPDGKIATTEKGVPRLKVYDAEARLLACLGEGAFPGNAAGMDIAVDGAGLIALLEPVGNEIRRYRLVKNEGS